MNKVNVKTSRRIEFIDVTTRVQNIVTSKKVNEGICCLYVPHTTAALTINENADPDVVKDINMQLDKLVPEGAGYAHLEGNADAHIKTSILGASEMIFIEKGHLVLGTWQGIYFTEFDGPRTRKLLIKIINH